MTRLPALALATLGFAVALPAAAQDSGAPDVETRAEAPAPTKGERELAKLLEGRVAGEPVRCIRAFPSQRLRTIEGTAYVYGQGDTIYVQRTRDPERIDRTDALVSNRFGGSQLCRLDIMTTIDPITGIFTGAVFFEDFVPYTRSGTGNAREG
jgi:hypothetical protein